MGKTSKKALSKAKKASPKMVVTGEKLGPVKEESFLPPQNVDDTSAQAMMEHQDALQISEGTGVGDGCSADLAPPSERISDAAFVTSLAQPEPTQLTLPLIADSATLFIQAAQQLTAQLLGTPECAPLLVRLNTWIAALTSIKTLIVGDEDKIEGLKKLVVEHGEPWGERGSKQMTLAGAAVKVKAVNWRDPNAPLTIADLDAAKVEAYLRGCIHPDDVAKTLPGYMKATTVWGLKDLSPLQQKNLSEMLADPGEWGQGLRQCRKDSKWTMMAPEMVES